MTSYFYREEHPVTHRAPSHISDRVDHVSMVPSLITAAKIKRRRLSIKSFSGLFSLPLHTSKLPQLLGTLIYTASRYERRAAAFKLCPGFLPKARATLCILAKFDLQIRQCETIFPLVLSTSHQLRTDNGSKDGVLRHGPQLPGLFGLAFLPIHSRHHRNRALRH